MNTIHFFNDIKRKLKVDNIEITLIDGDTMSGFDFVIFINTGADMVRIFHSGLEDNLGVETIVDTCRRNIYKKAKELIKLV